jgi:HD-GYP domain-containing protein (c-di-GMP phosphodiesterase class II)
MLHDIGKARIPLAILEKPGRLDDAEMAAMRNHPQFGIDALATVPGLSREMLDMVVHHHEYLDGSGYPHGLHGGEISDLVRMITISDVFGALSGDRTSRPCRDKRRIKSLSIWGRSSIRTWCGPSGLSPLLVRRGNSK